MTKIIAGFFAASVLAASAHSAEVFVTVTQNNTFEPAVVFARPGDTVTWTYAGGLMPHDVHADDDSYFNTLSSAPWTFSHTFPAATRSRYYCTAHGAPGGIGMSGIVVVENRTAWAPADIVRTIGAWDFTKIGTPNSPADSRYHRESGDYISGVDLPSGARITGLELSACSGSVNPLQASLLECAGGDEQCTVVASINAAPTATCEYSSLPITGVTVGNLHKTYVVHVLVPSGSGNSLRAVRVFYRTQVSPAPATATFSDVPTSDPRFRFIEALAAAGITGGCAPGLYCPDASLTRGQMAVFLSVALGLYFPN